ncbi:hypothetical protein F5Y14DRAFT_242341 [Nemania sp. NC0429]|nr:hypothetical protein F5Y14DRAFT_242341 [Nemania sp. NC0429]
MIMASASKTKTHYHLHNHPDHSHLRWSRSIPPVLTVASGAEITLELPDGGGNQITRENAAAGTALSSFDLSQADPGIGPIYVEGAEPGDVLRVDFLAIEPLVDFGWTAVFPGFGLLSDDDEFADVGHGVLKILDLGTPGGGDWVADRGYIVFRRGASQKKASVADGNGNEREGKVKGEIRTRGEEEEEEEEEEIRIPYRPFLGLVGVAPAEGEHSMIPPRETGGNIDTRWLGVGGSLFLPVQVRGALLSLGDGHAAQGDGEVCGTAVETRMRARIRVSVEKGKAWVRSPWVLTPARERERERERENSGGGGEQREFMCLGVHSDLREATKRAVRGVVEWLAAEKGLDRAEAYMLVSVAGHLRMCEVVDMPNYAIGCAIPLDIFVPVDSGS